MRILNLFLALSVVAFMSCGKTTEKKEETSIKINQAPKEAEPVQEEGVANVVIESNDQMRYNLSEIKVSAGDKVNLTLKHVGQLDKNVMGHNFMLLKPGVDINDFAKKALKAKANDYIPVDSPDVIVHTKMIGGGEEVSITFDAPEAGTYEFICSFPGHVALMNGKFIVE
jgi:azurin